LLWEGRRRLVVDDGFAGLANGLDDVFVAPAVVGLLLSIHHDAAFPEAVLSLTDCSFAVRAHTLMSLDV
jgi:hypothetical protein